MYDSANAFHFTNPKRKEMKKRFVGLKNTHKTNDNTSCLRCQQNDKNIKML